MQSPGGMGYMEEYPMARYFRDSRLMSIGAGADEIMLGIIAKFEGIAPRRSSHNRRSARADRSNGAGPSNKVGSSVQYQLGHAGPMVACVPEEDFRGLGALV